MNARILGLGAAAGLAGLVLIAPAQPARGDDAQTLRALFGSESEARGAFDSWVPELLDAVQSDPESPYARAAVSKVRNLLEYATDPTLVEQRLEPLLSRGVRDAETREALQDLLVARARARGEFERAEAYGANDGYVTRFAVIGPFGGSNQTHVHRVYPPERRDIDPTASMRGLRGPISWHALPQLGTGAWVSPHEQIRQGGSGTTYSMARLRSERPGTFAVKTWCRDSFAVFVNGRRALVADRARDRLPEVIWTTIRLEEGWNRVVVKVAGRAGFSFKLTDPATGLPALDVEAGDPLMETAAPAPQGEAAARTYRTPLERTLEVAGEPGPGGHLRASAAALGLQGAGRGWEAHEMWSAAVEQAAGAPPAERANVLAAHGRFLATFNELPPVYRKLRAKEAFSATVEAYPGHNSAAVRLARYEDEDDHPDRAMTALREFVAENPTATAFMAMAEICRKRGWENEAISSAEAALSVSPNLTDAITFLVEFDRRYGNRKAVERRMTQLLAIDAGSGTALNEMVRMLRDRGDHERALELLQELSDRWPDVLGYRRQMAEIQRHLGQYVESHDQWRALAKLVSEEESYPREMGEILEIQGKTAEALEAYERSLEIQPYQPPLWRVIGRLRGEPEDFAARFEPNVEELIGELPPDEELVETYPKAVAITVLDHAVTKVYPDGSHSTIVHMVYKVLNEKGVSKYGDVSNSGELLEIRTIQPDGEVWTPTGMGRRAYNLEGLVPGSVVDHRFLIHARAAPKGFNFGKFVFQDTGRGNAFRGDPNPVSLSRFVVLSPEGMELSPRKSNFPEEPEVREVSGMTATIWEKRDMPRIDFEQNMPDADEIVPWVDYSPLPSMEDANWNYLASRPDTREAPLITETLASIVKDGMSDLEKLNAMYEFVNDEITGDYGTGTGVSGILLEKAGSRRQLFEALVRAAGIPHRTGRAMAWNGHGRDLTTPDPSLFNGSCLWLEPRDADPIPFFMGSRSTPFGLVPRQYRGSSVFLTSEQGGEIRRLPEGGIPVDDTASFTIHLGADETATRVSGDIHYRSPNGYAFKRRLTDMPQDDRRKFAEAQLGSYFVSPTLETFAFPELDERGAHLTVRVAGTMARYLAKQGDGFVASLGLPPTDMTGRFVHRPERKYDLVLRTRDTGVDEVVIHLGDAFEVDELPEDHLAVHALGTYSLTWRLDGNTVRARRERILHPATYEPDDYGAFVKWCKDIDDAEERKLELRKR